MDRYQRLCQERFPVRLEEDKHLLSNLLLGGDLPWAWVQWANQFLGTDLQKAAGKYLHLLDSFCNFGDKMGQGITRASFILAGMKRDDLEAELGRWMQSNVNALGEQFMKGCYWRKLEAGDILPYGIFQCSPLVNLLATVYSVRTAETKLGWFGTRKTVIKGVKATRLCLKHKDSWESVQKQVFEVFPEFKPENFGSGPNKLGVFIQESVDVDWESFRSRLPKLVEKLKL